MKRIQGLDKDLNLYLDKVRITLSEGVHLSDEEMLASLKEQLPVEQALQLREQVYEDMLRASSKRAQDHIIRSKSIVQDVFGKQGDVRYKGLAVFTNQDPLRAERHTTKRFRKHPLSEQRLSELVEEARQSEREAGRPPDRFITHSAANIAYYHYPKATWNLERSKVKALDDAGKFTVKYEGRFKLYTRWAEKGVINSIVKAHGIMSKPPSTDLWAERFIVMRRHWPAMIDAVYDNFPESSGYEIIEKHQGRDFMGHPRDQINQYEWQREQEALLIRDRNVRGTETEQEQGVLYYAKFNIFHPDRSHRLEIQIMDPVGHWLFEYGSRAHTKYANMRSRDTQETLELADRTRSFEYLKAHRLLLVVTPSMIGDITHRLDNI